jgi:hypothetical protein
MTMDNSAEKDRGLTYYVRDSTGHDYRVGTWRDGRYHRGSRADALRECALLDEPGSYVWGRTTRVTSPEGGAR